jgi:uncharacterized protein (DUF2249 family)
MTETNKEQTIDARQLPSRHKHTTIFSTWNQLPAGGALLLVNDHDPLPLYFQFSCEHVGEFHWEYLEQGPETWRVRIRKGVFPDPGFVPPKKKAVARCGGAVPAQEPLVLDTRPIFARGGTPCGAIDDAIASLGPAQPFVLLVPFEPVPLYAKLANDGFTHKAEPQPDGTWRIEFRR